MTRSHLVSSENIQTNFLQNKRNEKLLTIIFSCSSEPTIKETEITNGWRLSEVISMEGEDHGVNELLKLAFEEGLISQGYVLHFFPDKRYTELT